VFQVLILRQRPDLDPERPLDHASLIPVAHLAHDERPPSEQPREAARLVFSRQTRIPTQRLRRIRLTRPPPETQETAQDPGAEEEGGAGTGAHVHALEEEGSWQQDG